MTDYLDDIFGPGGAFAARFPGYEPRPGQIALARAVDAAFADGEHLAAEGPCGTGKGIAYLTPAIHHAVTRGKRVVVATANIALQEQLVTKDLPLLAEILPWEFSFALLKGKNNFLCTDRMFESEVGDLFDAALSPEHASQLDELHAWANQTTTGDVSEIPFTPPWELWNRMCGHTEECDGNRCKKTQCFAWQARQRAKEAHVVVTNYHLLFAHLAVKVATGLDLVLPEHDLVVCDEAHEMAEIAREFFGFRVTEAAVHRLIRPLNKAGNDKLARRLTDAATAFFAAVQDHARSPRYKARIKTANFADAGSLLAALEAHTAFWAPRISTAVNEEEARRAQRQLDAGDRIRERVQAAVTFADRNFVYWIEEAEGRVTLRGKPIDVAPYLAEQLFAATQSVVVTSATLTTGGTFGFIREQLGLADGRELAVESPFDFQEQALLVVPEMASDANSPSFPGEAALEFQRILDLAGGRTLGLFTSYKNLHAVYDRIVGKGHRILVQGERPRTQLVQEFKDDVASVLLGTASFWTGVDVPGEALSCVVIDKLPFPSPDDPVMDAIRARDRNSFMKHSVPRAVIALRQGFGRLIRSRTDRGVVVILDKRIAEKPYGKVFLASLPACPKTRQLESIARFLGVEADHDPYA